MNREINKKQIKVASSEGKYVTKIELFQELKEIKNGIKEVKKAVVASNQSKKEIKKEDTKITELEVRKDKLVAQLSDGRELSIPIDWFAKWGVENVTSDKLRNYEIWRGKNIHFIDINEVLGIEKFIGGFNAPCE